MNTIFLGRVSSTLGLAALGVICGGLSAQAETISTVAADPTVAPLISQNQAFPAQANPASAGTLAEVARSAANETSVTASSESTNQTLDSQLVLEPSDVLSQDDNAVAVDSTVEQSDLTASGEVAETEMMPEAASQAAASVLTDSTSEISEATATSASTVAQSIPSEISPGRATASSPSYFGIGGNFGVSGSSALGNQSLVLLSKIGITRFFSVRPSVYVDFDDDATFLIPVTIDLPATSLFFIPGIEIAPYVGGGLAASTSDGIGGSVIAGIDWPIAPQFTVTSGVNLGFIDDFNLGVQIGIGYNFSGF